MRRREGRLVWALRRVGVRVRVGGMGGLAISSPSSSPRREGKTRQVRFLGVTQTNKKRLGWVDQDGVGKRRLWVQWKLGEGGTND